MSFSVPTSPAMSRSTKAQPVTPQRLSRQQQPRSQTFYRSPLTPSASPYTPMSLRSLDSTGSSTLTTPDNIGINVRKRLAFAAVSPEAERNANTSKDRSLADIAENWRSRADENGIKVGYATQDDSKYIDDDSSDMSLSDVAGDSSVLTTEEALLAAPFLATHRRLNSLPVITNRPRAQSYASLPPSRVQPSSPVTSKNDNRVLHATSPAQPRRTVGYAPNLMSTPPPNRALTRQMKLKGSLTDPPRPRRREALANVSIPHNIGHKNASMSLTLEPDTSLDLFDIDENDFEYEHDYQGTEAENSFSRDLQALQSNSYGYPTFAPPPQHVQQQSFNQPTFADPFYPSGNLNGLQNSHMLNNIAESVEHHFHVGRQQQPQNQYFDDMRLSGPTFYNPVATRHPHHFNQAMPQAYATPNFVPIPHGSHQIQAQPMLTRPVPQRSFSNSSSNFSAPPSMPDTHPTDCSVCLVSHPATLAVLQPCRHPLCRSCLTSALNIVGEKDMECAVCKQSVADFKLIIVSTKGDAAPKANANDSFQDSGYLSNVAGTSASGPSTFSASSPKASSLASGDDSGDLESAFEFGLDLGLRASTPKMEQQLDHLTDNRSHGHTSSMGTKRDFRSAEDNVVLRIDNVPWDITPTQINKWLQQPVERVHVLLDPKGKTLSHAYVEVKSAATAGAILRGEACSSIGKKERGSVLGRGRRARGVTITRSGQQELMTDLFPLWRGTFDGSRPSLTGLQGDRIIAALEGGLLTENEISGLLRLIREPDSHFLKVPSLPFHSLISLLSKFPTDVDSRVFWSAGTRDMLFDVTYTAIQILLPRIEKEKENDAKFPEHTMDLVLDLLRIAMDCKAFTTQQIRQLADITEASSLSLSESNASLSSETSGIPDHSGSSFSSGLPSSLDNPALAPNEMVENEASTSSDRSLDDLAKEFGVDAQVVQALMQRLAKLG